MLSTGFPRWEGDLFGFFVAELAEALAQAGEEVRVLCPADPGAPLRELKDGYAVTRVRYAWPARLQRLAYGAGLVPNIRAKPLLSGLLPSFLGALAWRTALEARRADVFHGQWIVSGLLGLLGRAWHGRPVVATLRGSDLALLRGLPAGPVGRLLTGFDGLTAVSQEILEAVLGYGLAAERVALVPNGVNTRLFAPRGQAESRAALGLEAGEPLLLWAGRIAPEKGLDDLLRAMSFVLDKAPRARLHLLGDGPLKAGLARLALELGLGQAVVWRPSVPRAEMALWYNAADLVVLPSRREGRPNVVLEALACGRPVLASRVGGLPELIEDGSSGVLVPAGRPEVLGRAAADLLARPERLAEYGRAGPERLKALGLDWDRSAGQLRRIYGEVVARRQRNRAG